MTSSVESYPYSMKFILVFMNRMGYHTAVLDADVTGPSIPKAFGIKEKATGSEFGLFPVKSKTGIDIMSVNLLLENDTDPVVWRGPLIGNMVKQFWSDVIWSDVDFMFIDMPPGTGDVPLTVFQSIAVDGIIVVTSPQELVSMLTAKDAVTDKITGFTVGADDYITKPFLPLEMVARVKAQIRRYKQYDVDSDEISVGGLVINQKSHDCPVKHL